MGTEMRIGIAAGLIIVAATSVYFIYGSDRSDGDLLLTPEKTAAETPRASDKTKEKVRTPRVASRKPKRTSKPATPPANRNARVAAGNSAATRSRTVPAEKPANPATAMTGITKVVDVSPPARGPSVVNRGTSSPLSGAGESNPALSNKSALVLNKSSEPSAIGNGSVHPARSPARRNNSPLIRPTPKDNEAAGSTPLPQVPTAKTDPAIDDLKAAIERKAEEQAKKDRPIRVARRTPARPVSAAPSDADRRAANRRTTPIVMPSSDAAKSAPSVDAAWPKRHTIASGDTLSDISMKYYGTARRVDQIIKANPDITGPRSLRIGREIIIPELDRSESTSVVKLASHSDSNVARRSVSPRRSPSPVVVAPRRKYTVQKGDTFYSIARQLYGSTSRWQELFKANKALVSSPAKLKPGMILEVPS